jgi:heme/copper-type cytochrome/quinol oxidase subunit 2
MDVTLLLTSDDYVYTLTSPTGSKEIAVPKLVHTLRFQAPETGTYEFRTDPMCGLRYFHDDVQGTMQVEASPLRVVVGRK